ncbi:MAG: pyrroline-5-carboxylate reductase [Candidatus Omnitrophica bacterium]|nr:pyrroline-5-carboxylate reductase [Candidatus Omnitrophota bacterium]MCM8802872.1 pyrroline-5-carboxylate reductase [Candidatus Omnitrophota bacterium]
MRIGIIGFGNMGSAIYEGIVEEKIFKKKDIFIYEIDKEKVKNLNLNICESNKDLVEKSQLIIIAVKPNDAKNVLEEIKSSLSPEKILVSIMAGIKIKKIEKIVGKNIPVIRIMPNLNVKVKSGIIAYCSNKYGRRYENLIEKIFSSVGMVFKLNENKFDTITAISGSGPGFLFYIAEEFKKICIEKGISEKISKDLVTYLFYGTGKMIFQTKKEIEELKEQVCSPKGTTIAGLSVFEKVKFGNLLRKVVEAAEKRSKEISES